MYWRTRRSPRKIVAISFLVSMILAACSAAPSNVTRTFTVGLLSDSAGLDTVIRAFKAGLADLGYVEGNNVNFQNSGILATSDDIDKAVQKLVAAKVDIIFAPGLTAVAAKKGTEGTNIPVLFAALSNPVKLGLVQSLAHPGGNTTGVAYQVEVAGKALDYLTMIAPTAKRVLVIYDPDPNGPDAPYFSVSKDFAATAGLQLVPHEVHNEQDVVSILQHMPTDVDAILVLPDIWLSSHTADLVKAGIDQKIPAISTILSIVNTGAVLGYGRDQTREGKQAARMAGQILKGNKPSTLPVESPDYYLWINLKTAQAIGLTISDDILKQAETVVR